MALERQVKVLGGQEQNVSRYAAFLGVLVVSRLNGWKKAAIQISNLYNKSKQIIHMRLPAKYVREIGELGCDDIASSLDDLAPYKVHYDKSTVITSLFRSSSNVTC